MADLARLFRGARLTPGTTVAVIISEYGAIGRYLGFVVRAGKLVESASKCLAPEATTPGGRCSPALPAGAGTSS